MLRSVSLGALIALEWARQTEVSGLVLCGSGLALGIEDDTIETMRRVTRGKAPRPFDPSRICPDGGREMMQKAYMEGIKTDPRATLGDLEASRAWTQGTLAEEALGAVACPARIVSGESEDEANRRRAEELATRIDGASAATIEGASHFLPLEQPAALAAEIGRIVSQTAEAS